MKRIGNIWEKICSRENIEAAIDHVLKKKKLSIFLYHKENAIQQVMENLSNETYLLNPLKSFKVYEPKERIINYPKVYPDRVYQAALMLVMKPIFISKLTNDSYGSIEGRGITLAIKRLKKILRKHPNWYFIQTDFKKFYSSINHEILKQKIRRIIKCKPTIRFIDANIDIHEEGLAIGTWLNQYLANIYLADLDHYLKEVEHVLYYFRYMDDIVMIVPTKEEAKRLLEVLKIKSNELKLQIKPNARIAPITYGINFLGYVLYPGKTKLRKSIGFRFQRKVARLFKKEVSDDIFKKKVSSYFGWCKHGNCVGLLKKILQDKIKLFNMEYQKLSDLVAMRNWFGLPKESRVSINDLLDKEIIFHDYIEETIGSQDKVIVKYSLPENDTDFHYFITRSLVMKDRLNKNKDLFPFIATVKRKNKYFCYE